MVWDAWVKLMIRGEFKAPERRFAVGVAFFRTQGRGRVVRSVEGLEEELFRTVSQRISIDWDQT